MNIKKFLKKYQLIIILSIIASILLVFKILMPDQTSPSIPKTKLQSPTQTPVPTKIINISPFPTDDPNASYIPSKESLEVLKKQKNQAQNDYPLWEKLPYEGKNFIISHYSQPFTLVVKIDSHANKTEITKSVLTWIKDQGGNVQQHKLQWQENL